MKSHRLLKRVFKDSSIPIIAHEMHLSPSTVYKWAEAPDTGSASGIPNPLDRALSLYNATGDPRIIHWLCEQTGGFYVGNAVAASNGGGSHASAPPPAGWSSNLPTFSPPSPAPPQIPKSTNAKPATSGANGKN